jgi:CotH kinase protein/Lamin Tail Domain
MKLRPLAAAAGLHLLAGFCAVLAAAQDPVLSEFQAANSGTLLDEDGDSSDWIEIHNPGPVPVDLGGWFLTDDPGNLTRWVFPSPTWVPAQSYSIVFASGKDRTGTPLHTDFKLKAEGEYLALVRPDGVGVATEYAPEFPPQFPGASFGLPNPAGGASYFATPTPRASNGAGGPLVLEVNHSPASPEPGEDLVVTAQVPEDLGPGGAVSLTWRANFDPEQSAPMADDGIAPDWVAGDRLYTGRIMAAAFQPGDMVRWKVTASDGSGASQTLPLFPDPSASPEYFGTLADDPTLTGQLPVWWLWTEDPVQAQRPEGARASLYVDGAFHDNVFVRRRGNTTVQYAKVGLKLDFNPGDRFSLGGGPPADEVNFVTNYNDKSFLRVPLAYELYRLAGCVGPDSYQLRLQLNGKFYSVTNFVEEVGEAGFLERHGLDPQGALYKMYSAADKWHGKFAEKKTRLNEDRGDLKQLIESLQSGGSEETILFDQVDVPACINYLAATSVIHGNDHLAKNYFLYRDTEGDGEWRFLPWDPDRSWGHRILDSDTLTADVDPFSHPLFGDEDHPKLNGKWNRLIDDLYAVPRIREMYLRRLRSLMDEWLQAPGTPPGERFLEGRIGELVAGLVSDVESDQAAWGLPQWGRPHGFRLAVERLGSDYLKPRRAHLYLTHGPPAGMIPPANPTPPIAIDWLEGDPVSGNQAEQYVRLRNTGALAADLSGWRLEGGTHFTFEPGTVLEAGGVLYASPDAQAFRARSVSPTGGQGLLVVGPYGGNLETGEWVRLYDREGNLVDERLY